jgi:hypothetical protein
MIQKNKAQAPPYPHPSVVRTMGSTSDIWANTNPYDQVIVDAHEDGRVVGTGVDDGLCDPSDSQDKVPYVCPADV